MRFHLGHLGPLLAPALLRGLESNGDSNDDGDGNSGEVLEKSGGKQVQDANVSGTGCMEDAELRSVQEGEYILVRTGDEKFKFPAKVLKVLEEDGEPLFEVVYFKYPKKEGETFHQQECVNKCDGGDVVRKLNPPLEQKVTSKRTAIVFEELKGIYDVR